MSSDKENEPPEDENDTHISYITPDTPLRAKILGAKQFCLAKGIPCSSLDLSKEFGLLESIVKRIIKTQEARTRHNGPLTENRGRKPKIDQNLRDHLKSLVKDDGKRGRQKPWDLLADKSRILVTSGKKAHHRIAPALLNGKRKSIRSA
jgi:hypothetical protein